MSAQQTLVQSAANGGSEPKAAAHWTCYRRAASINATGPEVRYLQLPGDRLGSEIRSSLAERRYSRWDGPDAGHTITIKSAILDGVIELRNCSQTVEKLNEVRNV